jgi:hypothetical protein
MVLNDTRLSQHVVDTSDDLFHPSTKSSSSKDSLVIPAAQEFSLFRCPKASAPNTDLFDLVRQEIVSIQRDAEERLQDNEHDDDFVSPESLFSMGRKAKKDESSGSALANEKLFGNISLSFFPIAW